MSHVLGKLSSSYSLFNKDGKTLTEKHAPHTMYIAHCKNTLDYIYYTPDSLEVLSLLDIPSIEDL
jgi:hypothetical protein